MFNKILSLPWLRILTGIVTIITLDRSLSILNAMAVQSQEATTPKTFVDWCKAAPNLSSETKHTVEVLLTQAGTRNCTLAAEKLSKRSSLNLTQFPGGSKPGIAWSLDPKEADTKNGVGRINLVDLKPIASLKNLKVLLLSANSIKDVSPLAELTNLRELDLYFNNITDIRPLSSLKNLQKLAISSNHIQDVRPLSTLNNLTFLQLNGNQIKDVSPLSTLTKLKILKLGWNQIKDVSKLSNLNNLAKLDLRANPIPDQTCPVKPIAACEFK